MDVCRCDRCRTAKAYGFAVPHGGAVTSQPIRSHPASGHGGVQPNGSDRSTAIVGRRTSFAVGTMVENPQRNQAEAGTPLRSAYGAQLRTLVGSGKVVRSAAPVLPQTRGGFFGFLGFMRSAAARSVIVPKGTSYTGQLPLDQQSKVNKPRPWSADDIPIGAKYSG